MLARAIDFLRQGRYEYTLEPPLLGAHSVDEFLFDTREGFCEHFSSAFVFLMRAAGIPARVVTGYQGGELNPVDNIITVRQSDAHAWAEVFLGRRGWVRVDPTAAAVPGRVESGLARAVPQSAALPLMMRPQLEWLRGVRDRWEAVAHKWNVWVLGYNPERQRELMSLRRHARRRLAHAHRGAVQLPRRDDADPARLVAAAAGAPRPGAAGVAQRSARSSPSAASSARAHEGPRDYAARAARALPAARRSILRIGALYIGLRYGAQPSASGAHALAPAGAGASLA